MNFTVQEKFSDMASGGLPQIIGTVLGAAARELLMGNADNARHPAPYNKNSSGYQNRPYKPNQSNPRRNNNQKELVKTMEKLVDAKEEARHQEMLRRRKAEREVEKLQQQLEKVDVKDDTKQHGNCGVKKNSYSGQNKLGDSKRGRGPSGRGGYNHNNNTSGRADSGHPESSKYNNRNNTQSQGGGYNKTYNKQLFNSNGNMAKVDNNDQQGTRPHRGRPPVVKVVRKEIVNIRTYNMDT